MSKSLSIPQIFGVQRKSEQKSIASIKSQVKPRRSAVIQPFWMYTGYVLAAINVVVMFSYLLGVNAQAATGYEIQKVQDTISQYTDQYKQLNLQVSQQASIAEIQNDYLNNGYVPVGTPTYLTVQSSNYALK